MKNLFFLAFCFVMSCAEAQDLARRPLLGIQMLQIDAETQRVMNLPEQKGVLIKSVIEQSTAQKAGFKAGDVLLSLNGVAINSTNDAVRAVARQASGSEFRYELWRNKELLSGTSTLAPMPKELHEGIHMEYTAVNTVNGLQRLIISRPNDNKKHPLLFFIGGYGCYSLDAPFDPNRAEIQLLNRLTRAGYVCVRAEKPGLGDNIQCTPCEEVSFHNEVASYVAGVNAVKSYAYVDSASVFVFGHSMGGLMAPLVARQSQIKGIVAYGTIGSNFIEYLAKTRRTLAAAYQMNPQETDDYIKDYCECAAYYFVDGLSTEQAAAKKQDCAEYLSVFDSRSPAYNKELYALNIPSAWKQFSGKTLLLWGEFDYIASREDHEIIQSAVNFYHPHQASFNVVRNATHGMTVAHSYQEALSEKENSFNTELSQLLISWLKSIA